VAVNADPAKKLARPWTPVPAKCALSTAPGTLASPAMAAHDGGAPLLDLPHPALVAIAAALLDERDAAHLRAACRALRALYAEEATWAAVGAARFGAAAMAAAGVAAPGEARVCALASRRRAAAAAAAAAAVPLDGARLALKRDALSTALARSATVVAARCAPRLELAAVFPGVLPGGYLAAWRLAINTYAWACDELWLRVAVRRGGVVISVAEQRVGGAELAERAAAAGCLHWFDLRVAFEVPAGGAAAVEARLESLGASRAARGLVFDEVRLERA
jgi:hypothetical protein